MRRTIALALVALLASPGASALAAVTAKSAATSSTPVNIALPGTTSPFSPGVPESAATTTAASTTPTIVNTSTTSSGGGLSGGDAILIAVGAIVVIVGIAFFIWRDARRNAPTRHGHDAGLATGARSGSKAPPKSRKLSAAERKRRKRGAAQRRARK